MHRINRNKFTLTINAKCLNSISKRHLGKIKHKEQKPCYCDFVTLIFFAFTLPQCTKKSNFIKGKLVTSTKGIARDSLSRWPLQSQNPSAS